MAKGWSSQTLSALSALESAWRLQALSFKERNEAQLRLKLLELQITKTVPGPGSGNRFGGRGGGRGEGSGLDLRSLERRCVVWVKDGFCADVFVVWRFDEFDQGSAFGGWLSWR